MYEWQKDVYKMIFFFYFLWSLSTDAKGPGVISGNEIFNGHFFSS